jgi:hypothetical protein
MAQLLKALAGVRIKDVLRDIDRFVSTAFPAISPRHALKTFQTTLVRFTKNRQVISQI